MRIIGIILIAVGVALFIFVTVNYFQDANKILSPLPENKGMKVIFTTPTK